MRVLSNGRVLAAGMRPSSLHGRIYKVNAKHERVPWGTAIRPLDNTRMIQNTLQV